MGQMTSQGEWPVGVCSRQAVRRLAARYTHRRPLIWGSPPTVITS